MWPLPPQPVHLDVEPTLVPADERYLARPSLGSRSRSSGSLRRNGTERSISSGTSRPSSERQRPKRKRSFQSVRRTWGDDDEDVEKEIVELNTIVEERREIARESTPEHHVAAVAPSMQIRARSETLDAIGSALSRPITSRNDQRPSTSFDNAPDWDVRRSISTTTRVSTRVSGWLSGVFPSASTSYLPTGEPFYKCQPPPRPLQRSYSESSMASALTETDSPSLTAASSPHLPRTQSFPYWRIMDDTLDASSHVCRLWRYRREIGIRSLAYCHDTDQSGWPRNIDEIGVLDTYVA